MILVHGAAGAVGSMVTQLAREAGAYVIGNVRPQSFVTHRLDDQTQLGAVRLDNEVDRQAVVGPTEARPAGNIATLDNAVAAINRTERHKGKTIIRVRL